MGGALANRVGPSLCIVYSALRGTLPPRHSEHQHGLTSLLVHRLKHSWLVDAVRMLADAFADADASPMLGHLLNPENPNLQNGNPSDTHSKTTCPPAKRVTNTNVNKTTSDANFVIGNCG